MSGLFHIGHFILQYRLRLEKPTLQRERFCLENILKWRRVDDQHLANQGEEDGQAEGFVRKQADCKY
jgi:hypothetical protein